LHARPCYCRTEPLDGHLGVLHAYLSTERCTFAWLAFAGPCPPTHTLTGALATLVRLPRVAYPACNVVLCTPLTEFPCLHAYHPQQTAVVMAACSMNHTAMWHAHAYSSKGCRERPHTVSHSTPAQHKGVSRQSCSCMHVHTAGSTAPTWRLPASFHLLSSTMRSFSH
jgi:hypothetical protein